MSFGQFSLCLPVTLYIRQSFLYGYKALTHAT
jgi:hypothetical protein